MYQLIGMNTHNLYFESPNRATISRWLLDHFPNPVNDDGKSLKSDADRPLFPEPLRIYREGNPVIPANLESLANTSNPDFHQWTPEEDALIVELVPTETIQNIAGYLNLPKGQVRARFFELQTVGMIDTPLHRNRRGFTAEEEQFLIANHGVLPNKELAKQLSRSVSSIESKVTTLRQEGKLAPAERLATYARKTKRP